MILLLESSFFFDYLFVSDIYFIRLIAIPTKFSQFLFCQFHRHHAPDMRMSTLDTIPVVEE